MQSTWERRVRQLASPQRALELPSDRPTSRTQLNSLKSPHDKRECAAPEHRRVCEVGYIAAMEHYYVQLSAQALLQS
jgi:hypothetical protein